jgi:GntR family transcriptional repressor for pyruvate dehydrogenase complex
VFTAVQRVRSFEGVVDQIRRAILRGDVAPGDRLPGERDLAAQLGVSRTTLREGLRALESHGLLEIRLGATGGIFVAVPDGQVVGVALDAMMHLRHASRWEMQEYRFQFEPRNAALAARRCTDEDLQRFDTRVAAFRAAVESVDDEIGTVRLKCDIHEAVAASTHNAVCASIMVALSHGIVRATEELPGTIGREAFVLASEHWDLFRQAMRDADAEQAAAIMRNHLIWI